MGGAFQVTAADLDSCYSGILEGEVPPAVDFRRGKVRDVFRSADRMVICASDRISAFDQVLATVPFKGQVLSGISVFWFRRTSDIVENHLLEELTGRSMAVRPCRPLPVEVVVRGYLTGSAWRDYAAGRPISGIRLKPGLRRHQAFEEPLVTPSTKAADGRHDEPVSGEDVVGRGLVSTAVWREVERLAPALFARGREIAASRGLILVDTKYEFGLDGDRLLLIDEVHTPDSSRYWHADGYERAMSAGRDPMPLDKEYFRQWLLAEGYAGDGPPPEIPVEVRIETARRYIAAFELLTGEPFSPRTLPPESETGAILSYLHGGPDAADTDP